MAIPQSRHYQVREEPLRLHQLQKGQIRTGQISSIVNFGAFVDLGGVDGLVHVSELSWKHIEHPSEVVEVGQEVTVEVLEVDMERERVSLSLKSTQEDPWQQFSRSHQINQVVPGKVTEKWIPVDRVGLYVPGGSAVYPSSVSWQKKKNESVDKPTSIRLTDILNDILKDT